jgi:HAD superfamily hydrolase (TIGR01459 family)
MAMTKPAASIPILARIQDLQPAPAAWLCDIWGVLHNGVVAFPAAVAACRAYRKSGGLVLLVSNAPRPASAVAEGLTKLGVPGDAYDQILTSGDVTREILRTWDSRAVHHIGPERDLGIFDGLDIRFSALAHAEAIICTGLFDDTRETAEDYRARFAQGCARSLPMLCANPDIQVERGGQLIDCAGALAKLYETMGGAVSYAGKPHPAVYATALTRLSSLAGRALSTRDLLAIGDGVNTDIKGAAAQGIRSVYIGSAVHLKVPFSAAPVVELFATCDFKPDAAMAALV